MQGNANVNSVEPSMVLEVVTVRKENISRLVAEYLVGGFMR
jgi:hypothetical protein